VKKRIFMNKKILKLNLILILCIVGGCFLRVIDLNIRSLEYDEIWTLQHYFKYGFAEIFTNLETPNNHPLHTWLAKTLCSFAGYENWVLRLSAFLSGIALMAAAWLAAGKFFRSKYAKIALMALIAFSPYLVHYSNTARGYSMQAFFVAAMVFLLFEYARKPSMIKAFGVFATAAATLFTVYSGLIFVCAAGERIFVHFSNGVIGKMS
jgi:predicted membrane-bound mannosyltransferase